MQLISLFYMCTKGMAYEKPNAKIFYTGHCKDFGPIVHELDVRRYVTDDVLSEVIFQEEAYSSSHFRISIDKSICRLREICVSSKACI